MKCPVFPLFLLVSATVFPQAVSIFYGLHIPDIGMSNESLYPQFAGVNGYAVTQWGQRVGWQGILLYSTAAPARGVIGNLAVGILAGQQVVLGPVIVAVTCVGGIGISVSDLGSTAEQLTYYGEATADIGAMAGQGVHVTAYFGIQTIGNLLPVMPGAEFLFYAPITGLRITFF
jgi:hypothetical protein